MQVWKLSLDYLRSNKTIKHVVTDPKSETRSGSFYVPRDEAFSEVKSANFSVKTFRSVLRAVVPSIQSAIIDINLGFPYFTAIDSLFSEGLNLPKLEGVGFLRSALPRLVRAITEGEQEVLLFETPEMIDSKQTLVLAS